MSITADDLNGLVEFDTPFTITPTASGPVLTQTDAPVVDCVSMAEDTLEVYIDELAQNLSPWEPVTGYSGQQGYSGPVMHASEYLGGCMARDVLDVDEPTTYLVTTVLASSQDGVIDHEHPAGWILLRRREQ